jgi:DNA-binding response OmpR family regulator
MRTIGARPRPTVISPWAFRRRAARDQLGLGPEAVLLCDPAVPWVVRLLRELRRGEVAGANARLPVLAVCADDEVEIVRCLTAGADHVVPSKASALRVAAELQALLRRCSEEALMPRGALYVGNVSIDRDTRSVEVAGRRVHLTPTEFGLLEVRAVGSSRAIARTVLAERLWGGIVSAACLRVHIARLRRLLADAGATAAVETSHGVGWRLVVDPESNGSANAPRKKRKDPGQIERDRSRGLRLAR